MRVFNHYKSVHGARQFFYAQNDSVELLLEFGFPLAILTLALLAVFTFRHLRTDSPTTAGLLAALAVFFLHSRRVRFYIPANLILAVARSGSESQPKRFRVATSFSQAVGALAMLAIGWLQFTGWYHSWRPFYGSSPNPASDLRRSLALWPFAVDHITQLRIASENFRKLPRARQSIERKQSTPRRPVRFAFTP